MKKHLLAAAVATAIAAPAMAQNVTISGDIHVGYEAYDNGTDPSIGRSISKTGLLGNSNISIIATEDLGGGMKVTVNFTGDLDPDTTKLTGISTTTISDTDFFSDERSLTLSGNFGALTLGLSDVSGTQGIDGKVSKIGDFGNTLKVAGASLELGSDKQGVVRYTLPKMGAVTLQVGVGQTNAAETTDQNNGITSVYGEVALGMADVYFGYTKLDAATSVAQKDYTAVGITGNIGPVAVGLKAGSGDTSDSGDNRQKDVLLSASYGLGNGFTLHGAVGNVKNSTASSKGEMTALALTKALSKRTTVYLSHQEAEAGTGANMETGGGLLVAAGKSGSITGIGIHHKF